MEGLDVADSRKTDITTDEDSIGLIRSQTLFGDKSAGFTKCIEQFKEVTNPVQFDGKRQGEDNAVVVAEDTSDADVQGSQDFRRHEDLLELDACYLMSLRWGLGLKT